MGLPAAVGVEDRVVREELGDARHVARRDCLGESRERAAVAVGLVRQGVAEGIGDCPECSRDVLPGRARARTERLGDIGVVDVEKLAQDERGGLLGRQGREHEVEGLAESFLVEYGPLGIAVVHHGLGQPRTDVLLAPALA